MTMNRAVTFRLHPSPRQVDELTRLLASQRELYNAALEHRRGAWKWNRESVTRLDQYGLLTGSREIIPSLDLYGLSVHRGTLKRLDDAFSRFFKMKRGYPRFRSLSRWDSVSYVDTSTWKLYETGEGASYGRLSLRGVGAIKARLEHGPRSARLRGGVPTNLTLRRRAGRWEATAFYKDVRPNPYPTAQIEAVGIDRGVTVLAGTADSDGQTELISNPRHLDAAADRIACEQQNLSRCKRGSNRRKKQVLRVARIHEKIRNVRKNRNHRLSRHIMETYGTLVLEDLKIQNMTRSAKGTIEEPGTNVAAKSGLNRSILDAGWGELANMLSYKAEEAGRTVLFVKPHHTSQICARCGHRSKENRVGQKFECRACGHTDHADLNAARNILARAAPALRSGAQG